jgi:hypothetical protein
MSRLSRVVPFLLVALCALAPTAHALRAHRSVGLAGVRFGQSVDHGDFNGDGRRDFVVGAPLDDFAGADNGRAWVWLGRDGGYSIARDLVLTDGAGATPQFGTSVACIGDVNDDGFDDIAVGTPFDDIGGADAGAVYVFFGGNPMNGLADLTLLGESGDDQFGFWVSRGGDLNGDGRDDFLVGAPYADGSGQDAGAVYLFLGSSTSVSTTFARRWDGAVAGDWFGWCVAEVPDFRGNGVPSFVVGAPGAFGDAGRAYLFYGNTAGALPDLVVDATFGGSVAGEELGYSVSHVGAFDAGDSRTDIAVGAPGANGDRGYVMVWYGALNPVAAPAHNLQILGITGDDRFGAAVADAGDYAGNTRADMIAGAPSRNTPAADSGHAFLFEGGASYTSASQGTALPPSNPTGTAEAGDLFGSCVSTLGGDVDGDGRDELLVGAPGGNNESNVTAGILVIIGSGSGSLPVAEIPLATRPLADGVELRFGGSAISAEAAQLWTAGAGQRLLAESGSAALSLQGDALVATLRWSALEGVSQVELRLWHGELRSSALFALPPRLPADLQLSVVPNPFNPSTEIRFVLPARESYELRVVDLRGRVVRAYGPTLDGPGDVMVGFDGRDGDGKALSSGSYRVVLRTDSGVREASLVLVK